MCAIRRENYVIGMTTMPHQDVQWHHLDTRYAPALPYLLRGRGRLPFCPVDQNHRAMLVAKLLRVLRLIPVHLFVEVIVERSQRDATGARIGSFALQCIEQVRHENAVSLFHLLLRYYTLAVRGEDDSPLRSRQIQQ